MIATPFLICAVVFKNLRLFSRCPNFVHSYRLP
jgi:hypothetical protein